MRLHLLASGDNSLSITKWLAGKDLATEIPYHGANKYSMSVPIKTQMMFEDYSKLSLSL
jgi:hypothetical protein